MTLYDRVSQLAKKQGISVFDLAEKLSLGRNSVYSWKKSSPKIETLEKVADFFDVSVDYLIGRTDNASRDKSETPVDLEEDDVIFAFDGKPVSDEEREFLKSVIAAYRKNKK